MFLKAMRDCSFVLLLSLLLNRQLGGQQPTSAFTSHVTPILTKYCSECHSADKHEGELDLTTPAGILRGGESGEPAIRMGSADESLLLHKIELGEMPPDGKPRPTADEVELLRQWIDSGASGLQSPASAEQAMQQLGWKVMDVLEWKCSVCHGRRVQEANFAVTSVAALLQGGKSGPAIVPGDPDASLLVKRIHADEMPPFKQRYKFAVKPVTPEELEWIRQWITAGAIDPGRRPALGDESDHVTAEDRNWWAFQPPQRPSIPAVQHMDRVANPIDAFVLAQLEAAGLNLSAEACRQSLIRRLCYDLTGLPPTAEEIALFLADDQPQAYERLVDRLLESPRYGERQAQRWLDAAGYAESEGLESADPVFEEMYRYRDYVVRSFNSDKPFDQFLTEQLAGDELVDRRQLTELTTEAADSLIATGFLRTAMDSTREPAVNFYVNRYQILDDTVDVVSTCVLGLSLRCARCHNHKYDPLSQRDYYRLSAIFAAAYSPAEWLTPKERLLPLVTIAQQEALEKQNEPITAKISEHEQQLKQLLEEARKPLREMKIAMLPEDVRPAVTQAAETPEEMRTVQQMELLLKYAGQISVTFDQVAEANPEFRTKSAELKQQISELQQQLAKIPQAHALSDLSADPLPFYLLNRGEWDRRAAEVLPGVPAVLRNENLLFRLDSPPPNTGSTGQRLALARWLTDRDHPLTSRVFVNRMWRDMFGRGIVATVDNFGHTGAMPTHPQLLDWLAIEFMERGWSVKQLLRLIVTSNAYRQASSIRAEAVAVDPENKLLWRMPLRRLDAEALRDSVLLATGQLNDHMYGPSIAHETQPDGQVITPPGPAHQRRSIYMLHRRLTPETMLETFDAPRMNPNCVERRNSTVVTQALFLLNSPFMEQQAKHLASSIRATEADPARQIDLLYRSVFGRAPADNQRVRSLEFLALQPSMPSTGESPQTVDLLAELALVLFNSAEFLYVD